MDYARSHSAIIDMLKHFHFIDANGKEIIKVGDPTLPGQFDEVPLADFNTYFAQVLTTG